MKLTLSDSDISRAELSFDNSPILRDDVGHDLKRGKTVTIKLADRKPFNAVISAITPNRVYARIVSKRNHGKEL